MCYFYLYLGGKNANRLLNPISTFIFLINILSTFFHIYKSSPLQIYHQMDISTLQSTHYFYLLSWKTLPKKIDRYLTGQFHELENQHL